MTDEVRLDAMSVFIEMDSDKPKYVDYFYTCDVYGPDPRYKSRFMLIGQRRGLFRVDKQTLEPTALCSMEGDASSKRFLSAASVVVRKFKELGVFPQKAQFASG